MTESVAIVVVTYNRADLLTLCLDGLARLTRPADAIYIVNNASQDHTREVIDARTDLPIVALHSEENLGGAGGFRMGLERAYADGHDRMWLMDDDVVPTPDCLEVLLAHDAPALIAVREDRRGDLVEKAAIRFDLSNPLAIRPKRAAVDSAYTSRGDMPETVPVENVSFEGFLVRRDVVARIGLPDPAFFIFYDDVDYALRARRAGFPVTAVRDAVLVRQMDFDQQHDMRSWKGYYMYRNLFVVHLRYGENALVRAKPYLITVMVTALSPLRDGWPEVRNVWRALRDAHEVARGVPPSAPETPRGVSGSDPDGS